eukprot:387345_1
MRTMVLFLIITMNILLPFTLGTTLYVTHNGTDFNNTHCLFDSPCGTLIYAIKTRENTAPFNGIKNVEIIVCGINQKENAVHLLAYNEIPVHITKPITITFECNNNQSIQWWQVLLADDLLTSTDELIINNLVLNDLEFTYYGLVLMLTGKLILNNCTFSNINMSLVGNREPVDQPFIRAHSLEMHGCSFIDMSVSHSNIEILSDVDTYNAYSFILIESDPPNTNVNPSNGQLVVKDTDFVNITLSSKHFISQESGTSNIENCDVVDIYL